MRASNCAARGSPRLPDRSDAAFDALLADPRSALRRPPPSVPLATLRAGANAFMASARGPAMASVTDDRVASPDGGVMIRTYRPTDAAVLPVVLFLHGGGFLLGSLDSHDALCCSVAWESGAAVVAVDYRLAPEAIFPAPLDDLAAVHAVLTAEADARGLDMTRVALAGDSAGGQLAAAAALSIPARHLALFYPLLDPAVAGASHDRFGEGHMLTRGFVEWAWEAYAGDGAKDDARFDLARADLATLPPTTIVTAACDPLRDEGEAFADRLRAARVAAECRRYAGMIHGFAGMPQLTPVASEAIAFVGARLAAALASGE